MKRKTIIITGSSQGIGKQLAIYFASKQKFNIVLISKNRNKLEEVKKEIIKQYPEVCIKKYISDISEQNEIAVLFEKIKKDFNTIDILINNAAISGPIGKVEDILMSDFRNTLDVNLYGSLNCIVESIDSMKDSENGKIINICGAGVGWNTNSINKSAYITSKYALYGLTESLSREFKEYNIDINCISPGSYNTKLRDNLIDDKMNNNVQELTDVSSNMGKILDFLISEDSLGITGKIFSSIYDIPEALLKNIDTIRNTADYTIRKIDNTNFKRVIND